MTARVQCMVVLAAGLLTTTVSAGLVDVCFESSDAASGLAVTSVIDDQAMFIGPADGTAHAFYMLPSDASNNWFAGLTADSLMWTQQPWTWMQAQTTANYRFMDQVAARRLLFFEEGIDDFEVRSTAQPHAFIDASSVVSIKPSFGSGGGGDFTTAALGAMPVVVGLVLLVFLWSRGSSQHATD